MEIHGFTEDGSVRVTLDGALWTVPDDMANGLRQVIDAWEFDTAEDGTRTRVNTIPPYVPGEPEPQAYRLYKSVFISRLSGGEAETMEAVLVAADAKLRLMFNSVEYFISDDPLFATLIAAVGGALGSGRAAELLAP